MLWLVDHYWLNSNQDSWLDLSRLHLILKEVGIILKLLSLKIYNHYYDQLAINRLTNDKRLDIERIIYLNFQIMILIERFLDV